MSTYPSATDLAGVMIDAGARRVRDADGKLPEELITEYNPSRDELAAILARAPE